MKCMEYAKSHCFLFLFDNRLLSFQLLKACYGGRLVSQEDRCHSAQVYGLTEARTWKAPSLLLVGNNTNYQLEGPSSFGKTHPFCSDCNECRTQALVRTYQTIPALCPLHGGYFAIEFARDVVMETSHYDTTQENVIHFLHQHYMPREATICVVSTG